MESELYKRLKKVGKYSDLSNDDLLKLYKDTLDIAKKQTNPRDVMDYDQELSLLDQEISHRGLNK